MLITRSSSEQTLEECLAVEDGPSYTILQRSWPTSVEAESVMFFSVRRDRTGYRPVCVFFSVHLFRSKIS